MKGQFLPYGDENPTKSVPYVTYAIIAVNIVVFVWSLFNYDYITNTYGFTPATFSVLTVFTSMFLHGGFDHIFGNMLFLYIFGDNIEDKFGKVKYIAFYLASGIAATMTHFITNIGSTIPSIGASGAISGVLGAYLAFYPKAKVHVASSGGSSTVPAYVMLIIWFAIQLIFGAASFLGPSGSGIAFWAHIGGFVFGYVVGKIYKSLEK